MRQSSTLNILRPPPPQWRNTPNRSYASSFEVSGQNTQFDTHTHTQPVGLLCTSDRPVAEAATYTTHNKHKRRTSMPSAEFEPVTPGIKRPQTYALDRTTTGIGCSLSYWREIISVHAIRSFWGSGVTAAINPNPGTRYRYVVTFTSRPLYPRRKILRPRWIGGWGSPRADVETLEKRETSCYYQERETESNVI
jgi:hypothetical protein